MLAARGLAREEAEDICQEVAWRVLSHDITYRSEADLYPWAATVARRLSIDHHRRSRHLAAVEPPDRPAPVDVAEVVEGRSRLRAVVAAMPSLSPADRAAIADGASLDGTTEPAGASRREAVRAAVRRHRARARLLALVEAAGAVVAWLVHRGPRQGRVVRAATYGAAAATPVLVVALSVGGAAPPAGVDAEERARPPAAASGVARREPVPLRVSPPHGEPAVNAPPATAGGRGAASRPASPRLLPEPRGEIVAATPDGRPLAGAGAREAEPDDPLVCVSVVVGELCFDV